MNERIVFFQGNTQYKNTGDVLINKSLLEHLRKYAKVVVNDKSMPKHYVASLGLDNQEKVSYLGTSFGGILFKTILKSLFSLDKVYLIAGPPGHLFGNSRKKNVRNLLSGMLFFVLRVFRVEIIKIGFSLGPLGKELAQTEKFRAIPTQHYLVRDSLSLSLAHKIGIKKARFFPDLAWTYNALEKEELDKSKIVLSFRDAVVTGAENEDYLNSLKACLFEILASAKASFRIQIVYQVEMDYKFCKKLFDEFSAKFDVDFVGEQITLDSASKAYSGAICIITNRLHGALLGYKYGALPIVLTDSKDHLKIRGIYSDAGIDELLLSTRDSVEHNVDKFNSLVKKRDEIMDRLSNVETNYRTLSDAILKEIFK